MLTETVSCVFNQASGAGDQSPMEIGKMVAAHQQLAHGAARLHRTNGMVQPALVALNLVRKTALQGIPRVVEPLLRVAHASQQLAAQRARATIDLPLADRCRLGQSIRPRRSA